MTAQIIILSDHRKAKTEPRELTYAEWVNFCLDPFNLLGANPEKPKQ